MFHLSNEILLLFAENDERIARERDRDIARCEKDRKEGRKRYAFKHLCTPWISIALHLEHDLNTRLVYSANERSLVDLYIGTMSWPLNLFFSGRKHLWFELADQSLDFLIIWRASLRPTFQYRFLKNTETCVTFTAQFFQKYLSILVLSVVFSIINYQRLNNGQQMDLDEETIQGLGVSLTAPQSLDNYSSGQPSWGLNIQRLTRYPYLFFTVMRKRIMRHAYCANLHAFASPLGCLIYARA